MNYGKPPLVYNDQLDQLIRRGLDCPDQSRALQWLKRVGYYRLSAYFIPFRISGTDDFRPGTTLTDIVDLYKFDSHLRLLTMQALDRIEVGVRAGITYRLAHDLGTFGYANRVNFSPKYDHARLMQTLAGEEKKSTELFVRHYRQKYTSEPYLPVWMATELLSFGALSKMYSSLKGNVGKKIAQEFGQPEPIFSSWLHTLTAIRNVCAHHNRLWNRELSVKPQMLNSWRATNIDNRRYYAIALVIQSLLSSIAPRAQWKERLKTHFRAHPTIDLSAMHFPPDWQNTPPWV